MADSSSTYTEERSGDAGGEGSKAAGWSVNLEQATMRARSSGRVILWSGFRAKTLPKMSFSSSDRGRMVLRKSWLLVKAR